MPITKTIKLVQQFTYGVMTCAICHCFETYRATKTNSRTGKKVSCNVDMGCLRRFARDDGWRQNRRKQWVCPNCAARLGIEAADAVATEISGAVKE